MGGYDKIQIPFSPGRDGRNGWQRGIMVSYAINNKFIISIYYLMFKNLTMRKIRKEIRHEKIIPFRNDYPVLWTGYAFS